MDGRAHARRAGAAAATLAAAVTALAAGCNPNEGVVLVFPDQAARNAASTASVWVIRDVAGSDLCSMLTRTFNPIDPDTLLVDDSQIDVPVEDLASGMGARLRNLSAGDKVFFARVRDGAGNVFLRGCTAAPLRRGQTRVEIALEYLSPPSDGGPDAGVDGGGVDGGSDGGADAGPPMLEVTVREVLEPTVRIAGAEVIVTDGTTTLQGTTDGTGQVALVATGLGASFTVTAVGETGAAGDVRRAATTLYAVTPTFSGTPATATLTVPLEASDAIVGGGGSISGSVTGVGTGDVDVLVRTPFAGPFATNLGADGPYTLGGLRVDETYSEAALFHDAGGVLVFVGANLALALSTAAPTLTGIDYSTSSAAPVNIGSTVTIPSVPAAYGPTPSFALDLILPRGAITMDTDPSPTVGTAFAEAVPDLGALPLGARILFRASATGAGGAVAGEAREERSSTAGTVDAVLIIPAPPTVSVPADASSVAVATARAMSVTLAGQFAGYDVVHARFEGVMGGTTYRWNLVAPAPSSALALPAMPVGLEVLQAGVGYTLLVEVLTVSGTTFVYGTEIGVDWTDAVSALNVPQRAGRTVTFSVVP